MKNKIITCLLLVIFLAGLSLLLYPTFSNYWNTARQTRAIIEYETGVKSISEEEYQAFRQDAVSYNEQLRTLGNPFSMYDQVGGYDEALNITGTGMMGYISISVINVELPIYHGTSEGTLGNAVGHLQGSSLPVGGESTHCVLSTHRGLPSAKLFTDLDKLGVGDVFTLTVLDQVLTYEVDQILIVEPHEMNSLYITEGEDFCTLVTCTPYGINTHRMLVRGHRVENAPDQTVTRVTADAVQVEPLIVAPIVAIPILLVLLLLLFRRAKKNNGGKKDENK